MRCTSTALRNKWTMLLSRLLRRILAATQALLHRWRAAADAARSGNTSSGAPTPEPADLAADMAGVCARQPPTLF
jgi:hypothetical protein